MSKSSNTDKLDTPYIENDVYNYSVDVNYCTMVPKDINYTNYIQQCEELRKDGKLSGDCRLNGGDIYFMKDTYIKGKLPLKIKTIALKRLRQLIGPELYFSEHKIIFFKDDIMYLYDKYGVIIPYNSGLCMFCYNSNCNHRKYCFLEFVDKINNKIQFDNHVKNGLHDKEFKYYLHHNFGKKTSCHFCCDPTNELCTVIYQDIDDTRTRKIIPLKEQYKDLFEIYYKELKFKASFNQTSDQRINEKNNEKEVKSYSFCVYPEFEHIYGKNEMLNK
jgi:hypothetical protein